MFCPSPSPGSCISSAGRWGPCRSGIGHRTDLPRPMLVAAPVFPEVRVTPSLHKHKKPVGSEAWGVNPLPCPAGIAEL